MNMKKLTWLAIVGTALLFMQVHADSVEQEVEKYIRMPPVIRLAAPVVSSDKNGREEWIGISLMGPMPDTDFYGIHCAYFIENNKNSVINGISISTYGDARLCNGLQAGLMLNESDMNGMQMALIGNQAQNVNGWQLGIVNRSKDITGLQTGIFNYITNRSKDAFQLGIANMTEKSGGIQFGLVNHTMEDCIQIGLINISRNGFVPFINWK